MKAQRIGAMMKWLVALAPVLALLPRVRIGADTEDLCRQLGRYEHRLGLNRLSARDRVQGFAMDVKIPLTKLVIAFFVPRILAERKGDLADQSAFFARQKWTLMGLHGTDGISPRLPIIV